MASRNIQDLYFELRTKAYRMIALLKENNIDYLIYCTYRSNEEQNELYAKGRTTEGKIITYAKGGQSKHNFIVDGFPASKAWDGVPLINGKPLWDLYISKNVIHPVWEKVGIIGHSLDLVWGMDWIKFKEAPHWELNG